MFLQKFYKNSGMSVEVYNFVLCNNSLGLFGKFEQTILFCSLAQLAIFYCNPILFGPIALEIFPACIQPYQTLKSRRSRPLGEFLHIKDQPLVSVQKEILRYFALSNLCFYQTKPAIILIF